MCWTIPGRRQRLAGPRPLSGDSRRPGDRWGVPGPQPTALRTRSSESPTRFSHKRSTASANSPVAPTLRTDVRHWPGAPNDSETGSTSVEVPRPPGDSARAGVATRRGKSRQRCTNDERNQQTGRETGSVQGPARQPERPQRLRSTGSSREACSPSCWASPMRIPSGPRI